MNIRESNEPEPTEAHFTKPEAHVLAQAIRFIDAAIDNPRPDYIAHAFSAARNVLWYRACRILPRSLWAGPPDELNEKYEMCWGAVSGTPKSERGASPHSTTRSTICVRRRCLPISSVRCSRRSTNSLPDPDAE